MVQLWADCGLVVPWNNPRRDIARKITLQAEKKHLEKAFYAATGFMIGNNPNEWHMHENDSEVERIRGLEILQSSSSRSGGT